MKIVIVKGSGDEREFRLHDGINTIGRGLSNRIRLFDPRISRRHCKIKKIGLSLFLLDLGTKNGTHVNGERVVEQELKLFDEVKIGKTVLKVVQEDYPTETVIANGTTSLLRNIIKTLLGVPREQVEPSDDEFAKFAPKRIRRLWRPRVDTDPPEGHTETVISHTDPDS